MFRYIQIILVAVIALVGLSFPWMPQVCKSVLYGMSLSLKSVILFVLPVLIFGLLFQTCSNLAKKASWGILLMLVAICVSNLTSTMLSFFAGKVAYQFDLSMQIPSDHSSLVPLYSFSLPKLLSNGKAMFLGVLFGIICGSAFPVFARKASVILEKVTSFLLKAIVYVIPLFISGFIVKLMDDGVFLLILQNYALIFALVAGALCLYVGFIYLVANRFQYKPFIQSIKNMLPAGMAGLGSMSSAAAMPFTILGVEKNSKNASLAKSVVPATVNIHLIGDCFAIPIFAFAILKSFGVEEPTLLSYFPFAISFVLAKFSVAAIPGGGVLVMLPILEAYLGLNGEMLSLITALYILFDPVITCANVLGNGAFAQVVDRVVCRMKKMDLDFAREKK
ncbi:MAG: dicarboxylate/amino acid:cation symporter [Rhabdochlamydiaceae bacterium]|nr:dicarboxylate/amino acid:cation symporter [Rhabdochlamydiaceae bacterium]